ncbi:hypothetical protein L1987_75651 [Smallanthus sonchifolius]|uniref:Uncharacterized protein n=1 Tax=Smallanthus sonchifolius TaxID=185202 RepID=A0ACB9A713_9ASTR|nr:hypothetical protein L1987_75651 [Smallanthus sonchifolius]
MSIWKDAKTSLHTLEGYYLIDLDAPFTWRDCVMGNANVACGLEEGCRFPLECDTSFCLEAYSYINPKCPPLNITAKYGCKICAVTPLNPISKSCKLSKLTTDLMRFLGTDGHNPSTSVKYPKDAFGMKFVISCAPSSLLRSLPKDASGVAAFSWSNLAFPRQLQTLVHDMEDKFALCLPSSSKAPGVTFLGDGPFYFTSFPNIDLRSILSYTPMLRKHIPLPSLKTGSVKLSTVIPYTKLRSDIFKAFVSSFSIATKRIPRLKSVQPFSLCLKSSAVGSVEKGFRVPKIDLETEGGKNWTISGDNSMKRVGNGTACLAFVDGGLRMKDAIVNGTFQLENNFLFLDLGNQKLGLALLY